MMAILARARYTVQISLGSPMAYLLHKWDNFKPT